MSASLQEEIQQRRPFHSDREEVALAVLRTADHLRNWIGSILQPFGVTMQQYNVLRILRGADEAGLPTLAIADRMIERAPGITRLLDRMEEQGWACRARCTKDRRVVYARITAQGLLLLDHIEGPLQEATLTGIPEMSPDDLRRLLALLADIRQVAAKPLLPDSSNHAGTP